ncbi:TonB-dependent hemoglobin/transferrin/lactoferrin family receptor [Paremcibacter congregatus]|uniref:TonB-dependent hemoglobin/transferrin/lactoferrin family receptor n=1 Tax=Paremcibacter congregatus TaxID=2043170 RepID=UPI003A947A25
MKNRLLLPLLLTSASQFILNFASASVAAEADASVDFSLESIVVYATRTENKLEDVAASVSVINQKQLEKNMVTNIRDMLRYEPGVAATNSGRFGLSGFNIRGLTGNRVKILVNGTEQSKSFESGPWLNSPRNFVDMDSVAQVEVLRGPASSLYGSDALAGVVAYTTKSPSAYLEESGNDTGGHAKILYDSVTNMVAETVSLANRTGQLEFLLQYTRRDGKETKNFGENYAGGTGDERILPNPYEFSSDNILGKIEYHISDTQRLKLIGEYFRSSSHIDLLTLEGPSYNAMFNYTDYTGDDIFTRKHAGITYEWDANNIAFDNMSLTFDWQKGGATEKTNNRTAAFGYGHRLIDYRHHEEDYQVASQFDKKAGVHHLTYGFIYQHATQTNRTDKFYLDGGRDADLARYTPVVKGQSIGLFAQDQITLLDGALLLSPGMRYDSFRATPYADEFYPTELKKHTSDKVTFRSGLVYKFTDVISMFGQFSQGFKSPELIQLYREDTSSAYRGYITLANPDLKAESSTSFEVGLRANTKAYNVELVGFHSNYDDFIEQTVDHSSGISIYQYTNFAEATISGIEARAAIWLDELTGAPSGLAIQAAFAYAKGDTEQSGMKTPIDSVAPTKTVLGLTYDAPDERWGLGLTGTLVGAKNPDRNSTTNGFSPKGYTLLDLTAYVNLTETLVLRAGAFNLTDQEYWLWEDVRGYTADTSYLNRFTQPGRNASVSLQYRF